MTLSKFRPATKNANKHTQRGLGAIGNSMRTDGYGDPMLAAADGEMISGSARLEVTADVFGVAVEPLVIHSDGTRPVIHVRDDIPNAQDKRAQRLALAANRAAELDLSYDVEVLVGLDADVLAGLFEPAELSDLGQAWADEQARTQDDPGPQIDKAEELQAKWQVKPGDLFAIGDHRLLCGDCREPASWARLLAGVKANGVFTSPPYAEQRKEQYGGTPTAEYVAWWEAVQANVKAHLAADGSFFVNIKPHCEDGERVLYVFDLVLAMKRDWGWRFVDELCWDKGGGVPGRWNNRFKNSFEPCFHFSVSDSIKFLPFNVGHPSDDVIEYHADNPKTHTGFISSGLGKRGGKIHGTALPGNVIRVGNAKADPERNHNAEFPVALPDFFVRAYSDAGDVWLDPFCGSGTTLVAAHNNKRVGMGIEVLPKYCAVILERLSGLGLTPERVSA